MKKRLIESQMSALLTENERTQLQLETHYHEHFITYIYVISDSQLSSNVEIEMIFCPLFLSD